MLRRTASQARLILHVFLGDSIRAGLRLCDERNPQFPRLVEIYA